MSVLTEILDSNSLIDKALSDVADEKIRTVPAFPEELSTLTEQKGGYNDTTIRNHCRDVDTLF